MPFMSLYLKGRFYAKLAIKYLIESFYAIAIGVKCIMNSPLGDIHKGKILRQPIKKVLKYGSCNYVISILHYCTVYIPTITLDISV